MPGWYRSARTQRVPFKQSDRTMPTTRMSSCEVTGRDKTLVQAFVQRTAGRQSAVVLPALLGRHLVDEDRTIQSPNVCLSACCQPETGGVDTTYHDRAGIRQVEEAVCRRRVGRDVGLRPKLRLRLLGRGDAAHVTAQAAPECSKPGGDDAASPPHIERVFGGQVS